MLSKLLMNFRLQGQWPFHWIPYRKWMVCLVLNYPSNGLRHLISRISFISYLWTLSLNLPGYGWCIIMYISHPQSTEPNNAKIHCNSVRFSSQLGLVWGVFNIQGKGLSPWHPPVFQHRYGMLKLPFIDSYSNRTCPKISSNIILSPYNCPIFPKEQPTKKK